MHQPDQQSPLLDFAALRKEVTIGMVLELIEWRPVSRTGPQLRGPCPVHKSQTERSRSFSVNLERNVFQCFGAGCEARGNQLDLAAAVFGLPLREAALELCASLGIEPPTRQ
ncbi:MAG: hypothetical protein KDA37_05265 [Planctomycetales bacterium]|nr:hypothetical protein [Planctomycetales bacterium]